MNHQPFESWIFDDTRLTREQDVSLEDHFKECPVCLEKALNWKAAQAKLQAAPMQPPQPGFTNRWQSAFAQRLARQQRIQTRRFLLILCMSVILVSITLIGYLVATYSLIDLISVIFETIGGLVARGSLILGYAVPILRALPPIIPMGFWILFMLALVLLGVVWVSTIWKITMQGDVSK